LLESLSSARLTKRKGGDKLRLTVEDIVKLTLSPNVKLPVFYAMDFTRLPPVDVKHCDVEAILVELQGLRQEVRTLADLQREVDDFRDQLADMASLRAEVVSLQLAVSQVDAKVHFPALSSSAAAVTATAPPAVEAQPMSYNAVATDLRRIGLKSQKKPVVGTATTQSRIKSDATKWSIDVFVSRLHPAIDDDDVMECVTTTVPGVSSNNVTCKRLKSRYEASYASYYVCVSVDSDIMRDTIDKLTSEDSWPSGILVRRYFRQKNRRTRIIQLYVQFLPILT